MVTVSGGNRIDEHALQSPATPRPGERCESVRFPERPVSIEVLVTAGNGPVEVRWFVHDLAEVLCGRFAVGSRVTVGPEGEPLSVLLEVEGEVGQLAGWLGTHALRRRSERRGRHQRQRWYVGVVLLEPLEEVPPLDPQEVEFKTTRASGPGGQHVNRTDSAVIALHLPSGISVRVQDERSQHKNRSRALQRLAQALAREADARRAGQERERWKVHHQLIRGQPVREWAEGPTGIVERNPTDTEGNP
jgi:putative peptide chain release factor H